MFIITQSTQSWYRHTIRLHVLHVSAYCGHQGHRAFTITLPSICYTSLYWPVFTYWECVIQVYCLCDVPMLWNLLHIDRRKVAVKALCTWWLQQAKTCSTCKRMCLYQDCVDWVIINTYSRVPVSAGRIKLQVSLILQTLNWRIFAATKRVN
jgi:hypothetical protein